MGEGCIEISIEDLVGQVSGLLNTTLPDPDLLEFYKGLTRREVVLNCGVDESICTIGNMIINWNRDDYGKPVEERVPIKIFINSNGGDTDSTMYVADIIKASQTPVYTIGMGRCYSAGGLLLMVGHKRFIFKSTTLLIHDGYVGSDGSIGKFLDSATFLKKHEERMINYIIENTNIPAKTAKTNYRKDWFMFAEDIIKYGCADTIIENLDEVR